LLLTSLVRALSDGIFVFMRDMANPP
jgi:hypothetical protein